MVNPAGEGSVILVPTRPNCHTPWRRISNEHPAVTDRIDNTAEPAAEVAPTERAEVATSLGHECRLQGLLAMPLVAASLAELGIWYTDSIIVGRLGSVELAAVSLSGMLIWEIVLAGVAVVSMVAVIVGKAYGQGDAVTSRRALQQGLWVATALAPPGMLVAWFLMDALALTNQDPMVITLGEEYLHAMMWAIPALLWYAVLQHFLTGLSRPLVVTGTVWLVLPVNLALNYGLVFGEFGLPALGIAGAGYASSIVGWLMFLTLGAYMCVARAIRPYRIFHGLFTFHRDTWRQIWRLGLPTAGTWMIYGSVFQMITIFMGMFGAVALAANHIAVSVLAFQSVLAEGLGEAASVRVAQETGAGRPAAATRAGWLAIVFGGGLGLIIAACLWFNPDILAAVFLDVDDPANAEALALAGGLAQIGAVMVVFEALEIISGRCLRGIHDTYVPMWIAAFGAWGLSLPVALVLAFVLDFGPGGLWYGMTLGAVATTVLLIGRWRRMRRSA